MLNNDLFTVTHHLLMLLVTLLVNIKSKTCIPQVTLQHFLVHSTKNDTSLTDNAVAKIRSVSGNTENSIF